MINLRVYSLCLGRLSWLVDYQVDNDTVWSITAFSVKKHAGPVSRLDCSAWWPWGAVLRRDVALGSGAVRDAAWMLR